MNQESSTFCPAPWNSLYYNTGEASVCCANTRRIKCSPKEYFETDFVKELKHALSNGIEHPSCINCWRAEKAGIQSIRDHHLRRHELYPDHINKVSHIEFRASNLCNYACIMCNAKSSSLIAGEVRNVKDSNFEEMLEYIKDSDWLNLTGGEPLLIKQYHTVLDHLIKHNRTEDITLSMFTNCSVWNDLVINKIDKFKNIRMSLSIDGVGKWNEFQRKGSDWNQVSKIAEKFYDKSDIWTITIHPTMTKFNVGGIYELTQYLIDVIRSHPNVGVIMHTASMALQFPQPHMVQVQYAKNKSEGIDALNRSLSLLEKNNLENLTQFTKQVKNISRIMSRNDSGWYTEFND